MTCTTRPGTGHRPSDLEIDRVGRFAMAVTRSNSRGSAERRRGASGELGIVLRGVRAVREIVPWMLVGFFLIGEPASSHVVMGTKSLHLRVAEATLVVRGRVLDPAFVFESQDSKMRRSLIEIAVVEEIKGTAETETVRFAQDGHAVATYRVGDEALFFLKSIEKSRELRALAVPGGPTHVSSQEHDDAFLTNGAFGEVLLSAVRAFAASEVATATSERVALIRGATLALLTSGDDRLASSALASLVMAPDAAWIKDADLPRIRNTLRDKRNSIGLRAGIIAELARRGLVDGDSERLAMLTKVGPRELPGAIRALGARPSPSVTKFLLGQLGSDSTATSEVAAEAAIALGTSTDPFAVDALASALRRPEARVRNAAIRGLGQMGTAAARRVLIDAAKGHPDPATRRRAKAEASKTSAVSEHAH